MKKQVYGNFLGGISMFCIFSAAFFNFEPAITNGAFSDSDDVTVTQVVDTEIAVEPGADVTMAGSIGGVSGGIGTGSTSWTVKTNNSSGFEMKIKANTDPALKSGSNSFANYTKAGTAPDYAWSVADTDSEFGYTVNAATPDNMTAPFKDTGAGVCGSGSANTTVTSCWEGLTNADVTIVSRPSATLAAGEAEGVTFQAQSGSSHIQPPGTYTATITVTATTLP